MQSEINYTFGPDIVWPKEFPELKLIDDALRCGICYDYIKTTMVTPCAHSYCSICIRKYLTYKTACPNCFEETFENMLRANRKIDYISEIFCKIRDKLIKHLKIAAIHFVDHKQKVQSLSSQNDESQTLARPNETPKQRKIVSKASSSKAKINFSTPSTSTKKSEISKRLEDILGSPLCNGEVDKELNLALPLVPQVPAMFLNPKVEPSRSGDSSTVSCPVCCVSISERNINTHLDNCLASADMPPVKSPVKSKPKRNPLPKMVWQMMAEKDLRKKLKDYGLNTQGDKKALISRIQRYIVLYNSECDSLNPKPISEIVRQVEREEKQLPLQNQQRVLINKKSDPKIIAVENKKYIEENKNSFKKLIEAMQEREGRKIWPLNPTDKEDKEEHINGKTPNDVPETVNLCDSDRSSSPVLGAWTTVDKPTAQSHTSDFSEGSDIFVPKTQKSQTPKTFDIADDANKKDELDVHSNNCISPEALFLSSPLRPPSPSLIITAHSDSDSDESFSILIDQNIDSALNEQDSEEPATENVDTGYSQLNDPDFVVDSEDQGSEAVFLHRRRSKRKLEKNDIGGTSENPSPRRTRRCLTK